MPGFKIGNPDCKCCGTVFDPNCGGSHPCVIAASGGRPNDLVMTVLVQGDNPYWTNISLRYYYTFPFGNFNPGSDPSYTRGWYAVLPDNSASIIVVCQSVSNSQFSTLVAYTVDSAGRNQSASFNTKSCDPFITEAVTSGGSDLLLSYGNYGSTDSPNTGVSMMAPYSGQARSASPSLRIGLICPWLLYGGAEAWQLSVVDALTGLLGDLVQFKGVACINTTTAQGMVDDHAAMMPVTYGYEAARTLASQVDIIITWHVVDYAKVYEGIEVPPKTIFACHLPSAWGSGSASMLAPVNSFVAVSELALAPIPDPLKLRSTVIWNAVDDARLVAARTKAQVRVAWNVPITAKVIGFVGRVSPEKGPESAIALAKAAPELTVVVVGDGPLAPALAINLSGNVRMVGGDHDKAGAILACDTILVPSQYESFGLTIVEALWLGKPVVSTVVGIASIKSGLTRSIPFNASGDVIATAVRTDLADTVGTAKRVADAKAWAKANLTMDRMARQYATLLSTMAPPLIAGKILAILNGVVRLASLSPKLDVNSQIDLCSFADQTACFCTTKDGVKVRHCQHVGRPDWVDRETCFRCQSGEFDKE